MLRNNTLENNLRACNEIMLLYYKKFDNELNIILNLGEPMARTLEEGGFPPDPYLDILFQQNMVDESLPFGLELEYKRSEEHLIVQIHVNDSDEFSFHENYHNRVETEIYDYEPKNPVKIQLFLFALIWDHMFAYNQEYTRKYKMTSTSIWVGNHEYEVTVIDY